MVSCVEGQLGMIVDIDHVIKSTVDSEISITTVIFYHMIDYLSLYRTSHDDLIQILLNKKKRKAMKKLTESINVSTRARLLMMTIPVSLEASVTKPLGFTPMQGVNILMYSSRFI